ncbi:DUF6265 family protein [Flavobacterium sp. '19STA2R22 D10 B1']|uniref:DUF6265 family protein n=1 Tax=Flavobacterium aerium TaxID=3037261 RepID=UPI00278C35F2|nr:DUF6265 family protein [Flavobacterium sp. '19STA2R22 D10 B1']
MKKNYIYLSLFALSISFFSCQNKEGKDGAGAKYTHLEKANWLIGEWGNVSEKATLTETWAKLNDSTFAGKTYYIIGKDTAHAESIMLQQKGDGLFYIPTIKDQNNGNPVSFELTTGTKDLLVFENLNHDFPQKITYHRVSDNSLVAEISGLENGKEKKESFPMKKK